MDVCFGLVGIDFALLVSDTNAGRSVVIMKEEEDKIMKVDDSKMLAVTGEPGDSTNFCEFAIANIELYRFRNNGAVLSTKAVANFLRGELATALRKGPYQTNLLLAGFDKGKPSLYYLDYLATLHKQNTASFGYGGMFTSSLMDKWWKPDLTLDEAMLIVERCLAEVATRLTVAPSQYIVKIVDKDGVRLLAKKGQPAASAFPGAGVVPSA
ncbi:Pbd1p protein [Pycnococcus provasolii]|uniref:Proteasome subunit beta n=2 Tax=Pycnococcus provasolii TaxID=41880 RepID=A0A830HHC2_9CHLO|nr:Pbd1p protein [Pycnococcus provasolii]